MLRILTRVYYSETISDISVWKTDKGYVINNDDDCSESGLATSLKVACIYIYKFVCMRLTSVMEKLKEHLTQISHYTKVD